MMPRVRIGVVLLGLSLSACSFNGSADYQASVSDADPPAPDVDASAQDADTTPDATPPVPLINTNLVVRYFMDEAASGQGPSQLEDSAPAPMPLPITYGQAVFVEDQGNRGLQWASVESDGKAHQNYGGTKLPGRLNPLRTITIEVVVQIEDAGGDNGSQIAGVRGRNPDFMLTATGDDSLHFFRPYGILAATWDGVHSQERMVLHLVYDTTESLAIDRVRLYKNGILVQATPIDSPLLDDAHNMGDGDALVIGNEPGADPGESLEGTIFYVAIYDAALNQTDVTNNAARLFLNDDQ